MRSSLTGPKEPKSTVLPIEDEAIAVAFRRHTLLARDDCLYALWATIPDAILPASLSSAAHMTHMLDMHCREIKIAHRLTKIKHPWTHGQAQCMNRTIKKAAIKGDHYDRHGQRENHLAGFINADNYARCLTTLKGLTTYAYIGKIRTENPKRFKLNPIQQMPRPNN